MTAALVLMKTIFLIVVALAAFQFMAIAIGAEPIARAPAGQCPLAELKSCLFVIM
ncbi:MAG: hypothetical protein HKN14_12625 [Marinicaulis sp.]|nr:hypothetical protein [Marinicaulis sp.]